MGVTSAHPRPSHPRTARLMRRRDDFAYHRVALIFAIASFMLAALKK